MPVADLRAVIAVPLWVPEWICGLIGRLLCRAVRRHNVTCRGRRDHCAAGAGLVDPDRWNYWPRR